MANVIPFIPRASSQPRENLEELIGLCRNELCIFGPEVDFDADIWDVTHAINLKGKDHRVRLHFNEWLCDSSNEERPLVEPFRSFAKSYISYQHAMRRTKSICFRLAALRAIASCLSETEHGKLPESIDASTLNGAASKIVGRYSEGAAYRIGSQLELIADFLDDKSLVRVPLGWRNPIRRPVCGMRVGKEFDDVRAKKLPSPNGLEALAKVFCLATETPDILVSSTAAIMCAAPERVNEVLRLPYLCEVKQHLPSSGGDAFGLRWLGSKGAPPAIKWVVPSMASVVQEAIRKIREKTEPARTVARWYEKFPTQIYLPDHLEHLRTCERLSVGDVSDILYAVPVSRNAAVQWCKANGVAIDVVAGESSVSFEDLQRAVVLQLPDKFPVADQEFGTSYAESMFLIRRNELHATRAAFRCIIELFTQDDVYTRLGAGDKHGKLSIFARAGYTEADGTPIRITSHMFRHYLNTLAQAGGLGQLDIAKWSGRVDVRQNDVYDHESDRDIIAKFHGVVARDTTQIAKASAPARPLALVTRDQFEALKLGAAHVTQFGYCVHDFVMSPCQVHLDCVNCNEHCYVKGEINKEQRLRQEAQLTESLLDAASAAEQDSEAGASRWVAHQTQTLARLTAVRELLDDESIPDGAVIRLTGIRTASRIEQAYDGLSRLPS